MKLTDKRRFWIFEGSVLMYSMVLLMLAIYFGGGSNITLGDVLLRPVGPMLLTGVITWLIADGKKWIIFAFVFEAISVLINAFMNLAAVIFFDYGDISVEIIETTLYENFGMTVYIAIITGLVAIVPTLLLSFLGYHLPKKYYNQCNRINNECD